MYIIARTYAHQPFVIVTYQAPEGQCPNWCRRDCSRESEVLSGFDARGRVSDIGFGMLLSLSYSGLLGGPLLTTQGSRLSESIDMKPT